MRETVQRSTIPAARTRQGASHTVQAYSYRRFFARRGNECRAVEFQGELVAMLRRRALAVGLDWVGAPGAAGLESLGCSVADLHRSPSGTKRPLLPARGDRVRRQDVRVAQCP